MPNGPCDNHWRMIMTINAAGLSRVRAAAQARKWKKVDRDIMLLRRIACGSSHRAAREFHMGQRNAARILERYYRLAQEIRNDPVAQNTATKPSV